MPACVPQPDTRLSPSAIAPVVLSVDPAPEVPEQNFTFASNGSQTLLISSESAKPRSFFLFDRTTNRTTEYRLPPAFFIVANAQAVSPDGKYVSFVARTDTPENGSVDPGHLFIVSTEDGLARSPPTIDDERHFYFPAFTQDSQKVVYWSTLDHLPYWLFDPPVAPTSDYGIFVYQISDGTERIALSATQRIINGSKNGCAAEAVLPVVFDNAVPFGLEYQGGYLRIAIPHEALQLKSIECFATRLVGGTPSSRDGIFGPATNRSVAVLPLDDMNPQIAGLVSRPPSVLSSAAYLGSTERYARAWQVAGRFWFEEHDGNLRELSLQEASHPRLVSTGEIVFAHPTPSADRLGVLRFWNLFGQAVRVQEIPRPTRSLLVTI